VRRLHKQKAFDNHATCAQQPYDSHTTCAQQPYDSHTTTTEILSLGFAQLPVVSNDFDDSQEFECEPPSFSPHPTPPQPHAPFPCVCSLLSSSFLLLLAFCHFRLPTYHTTMLAFAILFLNLLIPHHRDGDSEVVLEMQALPGTCLIAVSMLRFSTINLECFASHVPCIFFKLCLSAPLLRIKSSDGLLAQPSVPLMCACGARHCHKSKTLSIFAS
jgi:hypothetical protein